jgi:hypothetical protein
MVSLSPCEAQGVQGGSPEEMLDLSSVTVLL